MKLPRYLRNRAIGVARRVHAPLARWRAARAPTVVRLDDVQRRLEILLTGMYGQPMRVRAASRTSPEETGALDVVLPAALNAPDGIDAAVTRYRLLAIEQATRLVRGTNARPLPADALERDLYMLAEGAAIDRAIARRSPGLAGSLAELRLAELSSRPPVHRLAPAEREVETLLQSLLAANPEAPSAATSEYETPAESAAWASEEAARIRERVRSAVRYRGVRPVQLWRISIATESGAMTRPGAPQLLGDMRTASAAAASGSGTPQGESREGEGSDREQHAGGGSPRNEAAGGDGAESEDGSARTSAETARRRATDDRSSAGAPGGVHYPEWDEYAGRYLPDAVTVRSTDAGEGSDVIAAAMLREHAPLVRQIHRRFAPLRAQRTRLRAQRAGDELDLDACVSALVDMRIGRVPTDRLYRTSKPARRTLAILLLVDVSGSTKSLVSARQTVLDVERMTVLLASEALDALGDPYSVLAFSGLGRHDVQVSTVKAFAEHDAATVRRRVSALTSADNTRLGAALRHATALLNAQPAERRLLLLLSDGQPNDVGGYQGSYAVEDSRRALFEARASGVHPFCLTVDREETEYLPHLFGMSGYRIMREPAQLPGALLQVVEQLLPG